jgi:hypothetical protein
LLASPTHAAGAAREQDKQGVDEKRNNDSFVGLHNVTSIETNAGCYYSNIILTNSSSQVCRETV